MQGEKEIQIMVRRIITPAALLLSAVLIGALSLLLFMQPASAQVTPTVTDTATATETATATTETATATPTPATATQTPEPARDRSVTVMGTGTVTATANIAHVYATVEVTGTAATEVLSQTNQLLEDVRSAVIALGVSPDDIQSGGISVFPNIDLANQQAGGYRGLGSLTITVRDTTQAGAVLEATTDAGARRAILFFSVEPDEAALDGAREAAFADARRTAEKLAQLAGGTLGEVVSIAETSANPPVPLADTGAAQPFPTIDPGTQALRVGLTVTWALR
jgi:uncharacterized protein YggE